MAEQAITAIFKISPDPIKVCTDFLKVKAEQAFECDNEQQSQAIFLSQLFFIVGHIGIQTIEYLEKLETLFKKRSTKLNGNQRTKMRRVKMNLR